MRCRAYFGFADCKTDAWLTVDSRRLYQTEDACIQRTAKEATEQNRCTPGNQSGNTAGLGAFGSFRSLDSPIDDAKKWNDRRQNAKTNVHVVFCNPGMVGLCGNGTSAIRADDCLIYELFTARLTKFHKIVLLFLLFTPLYHKTRYLSISHNEILYNGVSYKAGG